MALMCFHAARVDSRLSSEGDIILLAEQDRSSWNADLIYKGNDYMNKAAFGDAISSYHIEAAIAYEHCIAHSFEETAWHRILVYYDWLLQLRPTALVALNRLMLVFKTGGSAAALSEIAESTYRHEWEKHYLYHSLLGELLSQTDTKAAADSFEHAITLTQNNAEKKLLRKKMDAILASQGKEGLNS
jgi:RNA polymerase sigma-70 factor (ECF subfamily)